MSFDDSSTEELVRQLWSTVLETVDDADVAVVVFAATEPELTKQWASVKAGGTTQKVLVANAPAIVAMARRTNDTVTLAAFSVDARASARASVRALVPDICAPATVVRKAPRSTLERLVTCDDAVFLEKLPSFSVTTTTFEALVARCVKISDTETMIAATSELLKNTHNSRFGIFYGCVATLAATVWERDDTAPLELRPFASTVPALLDTHDRRLGPAELQFFLRWAPELLLHTSRTLTPVALAELSRRAHYSADAQAEAVRQCAVRFGLVATADVEKWITETALMVSIPCALAWRCLAASCLAGNEEMANMCLFYCREFAMSVPKPKLGLERAAVLCAPFLVDADLEFVLPATLPKNLLRALAVASPKRVEQLLRLLPVTLMNSTAKYADSPYTGTVFSEFDDTQRATVVSALCGVDGFIGARWTSQMAEIGPVSEHVMATLVESFGTDRAAWSLAVSMLPAHAGNLASLVRAVKSLTPAAAC